MISMVSDVLPDVCLVGSFRFYRQMCNVEDLLTDHGIKCVKSYPFPNDNPTIERDKRQITVGTTHHLGDVKRGSIIYVVNKGGDDVQDGYVGRSTSAEIGVAYGLGKEIYAMYEIDDPAVEILINGILSPEELIKLIKKR